MCIRSQVECHSRSGSLSYPVSFLRMVSWLEVAQTQYCCSRLPDRARLRTPWRDVTGQHRCSPAAPRCQAVHQGNSRTRCLTVTKASASLSPDISTAGVTSRLQALLSLTQRLLWLTRVCNDSGRQPYAEPHRFEGLNWIQQRGMPQSLSGIVRKLSPKADRIAYLLQKQPCVVKGRMNTLKSCVKSGQ